MDSNTFMWSCSRRKFTEVISKEKYQERLFHKFNAVWYLYIRSKDCYRGSSGYQAYSKYPVWDIQLKREGGKGATTVTTKVIRNTFFPHPRELRYSKRNEYLQIAEIIWSDVKNFFLDIILIFKEEEEENSSHDSYQISYLEALSWNLEKMFHKGKFSDIRVKCSSFSMRAHKNILSARSPVFEAYFMSPMKEKEQYVVVIDDMEPDVCRAMLFYIYCGQVNEKSTSVVCGLLCAAEKYKIGSLKQECVERLKFIMSDENIYEILEAANLNDKGLKNYAINFLCSRFSILSASVDWETFKSECPVLALEIYSRLSINDQ